MRAGALTLLILFSSLVLSCGQKDPAGVGYGSLFVSSTPQGATILIDGESTGRVTPNTIEQIKWGDHTVAVELAGYESNPVQRVVEISPGEQPSLHFALSLITSSSRVVLLEEYTNTSCVPCADASPLLDAIVSEFGREQVVAIKYHPWWPGATDPFYLYNTVDNRTRVEFYGIQALPDLVVDGTNGPPSLDSMAIVTSIQNRLARPSPFILNAEYEIIGDQYSVNAQLIAVDDPENSDLHIHFVVIESEIHIHPPPGINGETYFEHIMRKMLPDGHGESFSCSVGDTLDFERQFTIDPAWDGENIETVVFVQSVNTLEVFQACSDHE